MASELQTSVWNRPLSIIAREFPTLEIEIRSAFHAEAMRMLHEGRVQLALGFERPGLDEREMFLEAGSQLLVAVASPDHPTAAGKNSPLGEEQLVNVRQIIVATGGPTDSEPRVVLSRRIWHSDNYLATLDLVQQGLGWAYLPQPLVQPLITSGALTEVVFDNMPSQMRLWVDIIWVKNRPLGLGARRYLSLMREIAEGEPRRV